MHPASSSTAPSAPAPASPADPAATKRSSFKKKAWRLLAWCLPVLVATSAWFGVTWAEDHTRLDRVGELLLLGEVEKADNALRDIGAPIFQAQRARTGLWLVRAFKDELPREEVLEPMAQAADLDARAFDIALITRAAFARGDFDSVLRLNHLADALGAASVPLLELAARIESGESVDVAPASFSPTEGVLAQRIAEHLRAPESGVVLRSRQGHALGHLHDGELHVEQGIDPRLVPRALAEVAGEHGAHTLHTSIDLELSEIASRAFGRFRGSIVLVDPWTGEILAAVSDRRTHKREAGTPAFEQMREPASISKLITTAAYLRAGGDPDERLSRMRCRGHMSYDGQRLYCPVIAGKLRGLDRAMAISCNVAFAELATEIGRPALIDELRRFGFDRELGTATGGRFAGGKVVTPTGDQRQLADMAIGLEATDVTPLHAALFAAVVASGGEMPEPTLLRASDGRLGLHPRLLEPAPPRGVLDPAHADVLRRSMLAVSERGTGMRMRTRGFPVAMKTGTASHPQYGFHVNYIGYGPLPHARVAFAVRITHQGTSRRVRAAATEVTARLFRGLRGVARERHWQSEPRQPSMHDLRQRLAVLPIQDEQARDQATAR